MKYASNILNVTTSKCQNVGLILHLRETVNNRLRVMAFLVNKITKHFFIVSNQGRRKYFCPTLLDTNLHRYGDKAVRYMTDLLRRKEILFMLRPER